jgi:hypothetical protein
MKNRIKQVLRENVGDNKITRIAVFDFDGTLVNSPLADEGKLEYREKTGKDWPYKGWWGRAESLDMDIFDIRPLPSVLSAYKHERAKPNTLVIMLTGRIPALSKEVEKILSTYGFSFDEYFYNTGGSTLTYKIQTLDKLLQKYPDVKSLIMWDDRLEHIEPFKAWGDSLKNIDFHITVVDGK